MELGVNVRMEVYSMDMSSEARVGVYELEELGKLLGRENVDLCEEPGNGELSPASRNERAGLERVLVIPNLFEDIVKDLRGNTVQAFDRPGYDRTKRIEAYAHS